MILLVVDMQPRFKASKHEWLLKNVANEIRAAKAAGWGIMFLEYSCDGAGSGVALAERTYGRLTRLVAKYKYAITVHKGYNDGSDEVLVAAEDWYGPEVTAMHIDDGIRVVGVNTEACVAATVNGLSKTRPDIEITVVGAACNGEWLAGGGEIKPNNAGQNKIETDGRNVRILVA